MVTNLVSLVTDALTPDIIARIAAALGLDRSTAQSAIGAAAPALLAGLAGVAAKPGGAGRLFDAAREQGSGVLANLGDALDGSGHRTLAEQGSGLLASLLGRSTQSELANAVGKFAGISEGKSSSLLGILSPIVLGTLSKQQAASGLDASGLANLLSSQKDNISAALPSGLANLLGGTDVLDGLGARAATAAQSTATTARRAAERSGSFNWLAWAIPLLALVGLAWYFLAPRTPETAAPTATTTTQPAATGTAANLTVDGVDLGASVTSAIDGLKASLEGITDAATAQSALPKLQEATSALEKINSAAGTLQAEQKSALAALITAALPVINPLIDKILAIPGVSEIAKPAIDSLRAQLDALAKA